MISWDVVLLRQIPAFARRPQSTFGRDAVRPIVKFSGGGIGSQQVAASMRHDDERSNKAQPRAKPRDFCRQGSSLLWLTSATCLCSCEGLGRQDCAGSPKPSDGRITGHGGDAKEITSFNS